MKMLAFVQGFSPQKRQTTAHIEQEDKTSMPLTAILGRSISEVQALLVAGVFFTEDKPVLVINKQDFDEKDTRHAEVETFTRKFCI